MRMGRLRSTWNQLWYVTNSSCYLKGYHDWKVFMFVQVNMNSKLFGNLIYKVFGDEPEGIGEMWLISFRESWSWFWSLWMLCNVDTPQFLSYMIWSIQPCLFLCHIWQMVASFSALHQWDLRLTELIQADLGCYNPSPWPTRLDKTTQCPLNNISSQDQGIVPSTSSLLHPTQMMVYELLRGGQKSA